MRIISISGLDGSGKSTQAQMLQAYLENQGKKVLYFHAIAFSFPQKLKEFQNKYCLICRFTRACKKNNSSQEKSAVPRSELGSATGVTSATWLQIQLRKIALIIDIIRFKYFKNKLKKLGYDFLITDRFFYDTIVNIAYLEHDNVPPFIERYLPLANKAFYLKMQPALIMTRDRVPDQGLEYLEDKKRLYDMYAVLWNFKTLDGSKDKNSIHEEIKKAIFHQ